MGKNKTYSAAAAGVAALVGSMVAGVPAYAGGGDFTEESGTCSMSSTWDMKAKPENAGRIEMEFSVDSNRLGQKWAVKVFDNRKLMFSGNRTTRGISRSFSFDKLMVNRAGTDRLVARAKNFRTGEICRGHVALVPDGGGNSG